VYVNDCGGAIFLDPSGDCNINVIVMLSAFCTGSVADFLYVGQGIATSNSLYVELTIIYSSCSMELYTAGEFIVTLYINEALVSMFPIFVGVAVPRNLISGVLIVDIVPEGVIGFITNSPDVF